MTTFKQVVLIPAFNSAATIGKVISEVHNYISDIIVVDDGSNDRTAEIAKSIGATVLRHAENRGKGAALATGFEYALKAGYDMVITIDSDGQHRPKFIPAFLQAYSIGNADLIIGSRIRSKGLMPLDRRFSNWTTSHILSILLRRRIEDSQSGYRLYSGRFLQAVEFESQRFEMETEAIIKAVQLGFDLQFIPITADYIAGLPSRMNRFIDTLRWCRKVLELI